ncbi:sensor histidine kinase [Solirubrobacter sp. CPCC 204708]|uniref:histidine kinase n=1 Tax=Solirubrobacter deserti TaxID=2282478 RepID=A0ABT4RF19_9ACTN|nr:sensor histidine kinase [Solirubrobacter deserti]MBE2318672.1 sensor histidine kinase [Solirubrobacter deserti]MDA0137130.1 sensor histidine kinase [Solirubrobacter deserti]
MRIPLHETWRAGTALGWTSVAAVVLALLVGVPIADAELVWVLTGFSAVAHLAISRLPWATLLPTPRGRLLIDLWAGGVLVSVCGLVLIAGGQSRLDLLLLLVVPFLAISNDDNPRALVAWMVVAAGAFAVCIGFAPDPLPTSEALFHAVLLAGSTLLGLQLARAVREATRRAQLEGAMLAEAHHRVKNSLQVVAELLQLGGPAAVERASERIQSIAAVHAVLARQGGGRVPAPELLEAVVAGYDGVTVSAEPLELPFPVAQNLGVVVNELVANALQHGKPPVTVELRSGELVVRDAGGGPPSLDGGSGLGLALVRQVVTNGLFGTVELQDGAVRITFDPSRDARPRR